jgi:hypothetical protein
VSSKIPEYKNKLSIAAAPTQSHRHSGEAGISVFAFQQLQAPQGGPNYLFLNILQIISFVFKILKNKSFI